MTLKNAQWVLASGSPRRRELLKLLGSQFEVTPSRVNEAAKAGETPHELVQRLAFEKAESIQGIRPEAIIIGADTIVLCGKEILGKPGSLAEARSMLNKLSGRVHQVITGVCVLKGTIRDVRFSSTDVTFSRLSEEEIDAYVQTGESLDKAGAYAIQGLASRFIERIEGCYFNVVGLPLARLQHALSELGWSED